MLWDLMDRFLWGVAITVLFITVLQYFRKGKQREIYKERIFMYGYAGLLLGFFLTSIFFYLITLLLPGTFRNGVFYGEFPDFITETIPNYILIIGLCFDLSFLLSLLFLFIAFEIIIKRTKYFFSIITFTFIIIFFHF